MSADRIPGEQLERYAAHVALPGFGVNGQARLVAARAAIVGVGGLGSPAAQYLAAERRALAESRALACALEELGRTRGRVRVVAHSLGCHAVVAAVASLPVESRPQEIHLCGPAISEGRVEASLQGLARDRTYLYHCASDLVLGLAFPVVAWDRALGFAGPRQRYTGLESVDVGSHFGFRVHGEYKNRFADFAVRAEAA